MKITINCHAYAAEWMDIEKVLAGKDTPILTLETEHLGDGDTVLGTAVLMLEVPEKEQIAATQIDRLQALLQKMRAEAQSRENALMDRINKLQALTFVETA